MIVLGVIIALVLLTAYICYRMAFYVSKAQRNEKEEYPIPAGQIYEPYRDSMIQWIKDVRAMPHEDLAIRSFDGLTLRGKFYEYAPGAPIELMMHGYRGNAERDLCGGVQRCFLLGHSCLIIDQRGCGRSDGNTITFGVKESKDCLSWLEFMQSHFGKARKIILTGISMGATTVLITAGRELPENVIGVLADCGFTRARDIIQVVIRKLRLPPKLLYPFVRLGACLFGGFDPEKASATDAMKHCRVPVIFFHGEADDFVPCDMSRENYDACPCRKALVTVAEAGHGLSYLVDPAGYLKALAEFFPDPQ